MSEQHEQRGPGSRAEAETQRRRRRGNEALAADAKLPIPPEVKAKLDADGMVPRWVNDEGNRMHRMTVQDDYEVVQGVDPVPVGTGKDGTPIKARLLAKRQDFINEDRADAEKRRKGVEDTLFRRPDAADAAGAGSNPNPAVSERYVTKNSGITRSNQILEG